MLQALLAFLPWALLSLACGLFVWSIVRKGDNDAFAAAQAFIVARIEFFCRWWKFFGPRLTDRGFVGGLVAIFAPLLAIDPGNIDKVTLGAWMLALFIFPVWETLPAGEKLPPSRTALDKAAQESADLKQVFREVLQEEVGARA